MINKRHRDVSKTSREWEEFYRHWMDRVKELTTCFNCGHDNPHYNPVLAIMLRDSGKFGSNHKCERCQTSMPWLDDRSYHKPRVCGGPKTDWGLRTDEPLPSNITVWNFKDKKDKEESFENK